MHETEPQEHDTWANMMLRYTKANHTQEHIASTSTQEHECKTRGKPLLSRTGMQVHRRLKPQCAKNMTREDHNNKACPNKNWNSRHPDTRQMKAHLFYHYHEKNILHELNFLTTDARKTEPKWYKLEPQGKIWHSSKISRRTMQERNIGHVTYAAGENDHRTHKTRPDTYYGIKKATGRKERTSRAGENTTYYLHTRTPNTDASPSPKRNQQRRKLQLQNRQWAQYPSRNKTRTTSMNDKPYGRY